MEPRVAHRRSHRFGGNHLGYGLRMKVGIGDATSSLAAALDAPLAVVTTAANGQRAGCVVGFQTQCSIDPVRYAVWVSKANHTYRVALFATHLAVHFMDQADHDLAELFGGATGDDTDKFASCDWSSGPGDVPLLVRCPNRVVLVRTALWDDGGDHVCFVGEPIDARSTDELVPLRMSAARDVEAGHPADDRSAPDDVTARADAPNDDDDARTKLLEDIAAGAGHPVDLSPDT
jgi:flavin reductase (DIM6/NTAB) family NADH-FMN oxidoreductase RutF